MIKQFINKNAAGDRQRHRLDGPAVIYDSGNLGWYVNGTQYTRTEDWKKAAGLTDEEWFPIFLKYGEVTDSHCRYKHTDVREMINKMWVSINED